MVDGTLAPGAHDIVAHRRLYLDEDSWMAVYSNSWDEAGRLWKFGQATMYLMPDVPAIILGSQFVYDLELGGYVYGFAFNGEAIRLQGDGAASRHAVHARFAVGPLRALSASAHH